MTNKLLYFCCSEETVTGEKLQNERAELEKEKEAFKVIIICYT